MTPPGDPLAIPPQRPQPWAIAHRGDSAHHRENTLDALRAAVAAGADAIETDVRLTADRVPVLLHDATLTRTAGIRRRLDRLTTEELRRREDRRGTPAGERVATLADALDELAGRVPLLLELKVDRPQPRGDERLATAVLKVVAGRPGVTLISFDPWTLGLVRSAAPEQPLGILASRRLTPDPEALAATLGTSLLLLPLAAASPEQVSGWQGRGFTVLVYTADGAALEQALQSGADGILGNDAKPLVARLADAHRAAGLL